MARQRDEILGGRGERPNRRQRLSGDDREWEEAGEEWPETRSPRGRRRNLKTDDDELDPSSPSAPWLPPARR